MASAICIGVGRSIQYFHMLGPKNRTDDAYFARSKIFCTPRPTSTSASSITMIQRREK